MAADPWSLKHRPTRFSELVFSNDVHIKSLQWLRGRKAGILHITGGAGGGKTVLVHAIARALRYNVVEATPEALERLARGGAEPVCGLNGLRNLLLVDEAVVLAGSVGFAIGVAQRAAQRMPVIVTSTALRLKDVCTLTVGRMQLDNVVQAMGRIYELAQCPVRMSSIALLKLAEQRDYDMRSVINHAQLYAEGRLCAARSLGAAAASVPSIFVSSAKILAKRIVPAEMEALYDSKLLDICLSSLQAECKDLKFLARAMVEASAAARLPDGFEFVELDCVNRYNGQFVYQKEAMSGCPSCERPLAEYQGHTDLKHFIARIERSCGSPQAQRHLQTILRGCDRALLSKEELKIVDCEDFEAQYAKVFKYKYHPGSSNAVKRDVSIKEILDQ